MFNKITILSLSILPISLILGNFAVNFNIILIDLLVLYQCYKAKKWEWIKDDIFKLLLIFYLYLIINSIISYYILDNIDHAGLIRSIAFIKFILLGYSFRLLLTSENDLETIFKFWTIIISIVIFDIFFERLFGHNVLGYTSLDSTRIVSFFKNEAVVGGLVLCFGFTVTTFFLEKKLQFNSKIFFNLFLFILPISIFVSGERSNFIKSLIIFGLILFIINKGKLLIEKKILLVSLIFILFSVTFLNQNIYIKQTEFFKRVIFSEKSAKFTDRFQNIKYFAHYDVSLKIFKDFPFSGIGNKNFRFVCHDEKYFDKTVKFTTQRCNTHPHQVHFEILSEQGLIGYLFLFYIFYIFFKKNLISIKLSKNIFHFGSTMLLILSFMPLIPGGSFFSTFSGSLFWIVFSIANLNLSKNYTN